MGSVQFQGVFYGGVSGGGGRRQDDENQMKYERQHLVKGAIDGRTFQSV